MVSTSSTAYQIAAEHLSAHDPVLAQLIAQHGPFTPRPHQDYYYALVDAIISQQLSVKAAHTIEQRFVALFDGALPAPEQILAADPEQLRGVGMSRPKVNYVIDLACHIADGRLEINKLPDLPNEAVIAELTAVKGIGEWTAHMFLIFALGRLDVLPVGDLGVRAAIRKQYDLAALPTPEQCRQIAGQNGWHPYESVASWYMWQSLDNAPLNA